MEPRDRVSPPESLGLGTEEGNEDVVNIRREKRCWTVKNIYPQRYLVREHYPSATVINNWFLSQNVRCGVLSPLPIACVLPQIPVSQVYTVLDWVCRHEGPRALRNRRVHWSQLWEDLADSREDVGLEALTPQRAAQRRLASLRVGWGYPVILRQWVETVELLSWKTGGKLF